MINLCAFLFDLDGTLIDSERLYVKAIQAALAEKDCMLTDRESLELVYGKGWFDVYTESNARFPHAFPDIHDMEEAARRFFIELRQQCDLRIMGSIHLLKQLSDNYPVAIVSGSHRRDIQNAIEMMDIADNLQFYLGAEDYSPGKPSPVCFLMAAEKLNIKPQSCMVFEDSAAGIAAAKAAGMSCVALQRNGAPRQDISQADLVLDDLEKFDIDSFSP